MSNKPRRIKRQSIRLDGHNYSQAGAYFITLVTYQRECLFGKVVDGKVELSAFGKTTQIEWFRSTSIRNEIELHKDEFVVMPNHIHGIIWISPNSTNVGVRATGRSPLRDQYEERPGPPPKSLGSFVAGYKASVTKQINQLRDTPGSPVWLRNYHDRVIRNERELSALRHYIHDNPLKWELDRENPKRHGHIQHP